MMILRWEHLLFSAFRWECCLNSALCFGNGRLQLDGGTAPTFRAAFWVTMRGKEGLLLEIQQKRNVSQLFRFSLQPHPVIRHTIRSTNRNIRAERTASEINCKFPVCFAGFVVLVYFYPWRMSVSSSCCVPWKVSSAVGTSEKQNQKKTAHTHKSSRIFFPKTKIKTCIFFCCFIPTRCCIIMFVWKPCMTSTAFQLSQALLKTAKALKTCKHQKMRVGS